MSNEEHPSEKRSARLVKLTSTYRIVPKQHDETSNVRVIAEVEQNVRIKMLHGISNFQKERELQGCPITYNLSDNWNIVKVSIKNNARVWFFTYGNKILRSEKCWMPLIEQTTWEMLEIKVCI
ncbi:hypothetical protein WN51_09847 [Melipona quadrifasciata]|uniref:Uncharacterized protein n=1 Tax=Melipona quadrifasciata TaxID=166423 RepID=A0A0M9A7I4_9HYME|nr:hypothetical protein WN51_09847 [Melipona quadrifasciata]